MIHSKRVQYLILAGIISSNTLTVSFADVLSEVKSKTNVENNVDPLGQNNNSTTNNSNNTNNNNTIDNNTSNNNNNNNIIDNNISNNNNNNNIIDNNISNNNNNNNNNIIDNNINNNNNNTNATKEQVYLSDIKYDSKSNTSYSTIKKDENIDGGTISLIVDGKPKKFKKGMAAHADSKIIYDVSKYKNDYSRFVSYLGVDSTKGSNGNGVDFEVYTSVDGEKWDLVRDFGVLKGDDEAGYIDIDLKNVNFIKLSADDNGNNAYDHAVYGDAKLVKSDYISPSEAILAKETYLSDIQYIKGQSKAGYKSIQKDKNTSGEKIKLIVDGETTEFDKGLGAHAPSTLTYDISKYKGVYSRFVGYVGIDSRQGDKGNGVKFTISTSVNGRDWTEVKTTDVLKGNSEACYVDIKLNDANYIKIQADDNGANGNDHAVCADAKLVKDDYSLAGAPIKGLKPVEAYDNILKANNIDYNIRHLSSTILKRALVNRVGYESIQRIAAKDPIYLEGINYLMSNTDALKYFITGGPVNKNGSYQRSLKAFCEIYAKYKKDLQKTADNKFNLRLAISISLSFANPDLVRFWNFSDKEISAVNRYEVYQALVKSGKMDQAGNSTDYGKWSTEQFKRLPITLMRWVVDNRINDDEVFWLADYALNEKNQGHDYLSAYNYIRYTSGYNYDKDEFYDQKNYEKYSTKYKFKNYFKDYGTKNVHRLWMVFEDGSVCGGLAKTYANLADTFGRPSSTLGQPGHAATITYGWHTTNKRYEWMLQNDIHGWAQSGNEYEDRLLGWGNQSWSKWQSASYTVLATDAVNDYDNYISATMLNLLADSYPDTKTKKKCYEKALEYQNINLDSMEGLINCYVKDPSTTESQFFELAKQVISTYTYYPQAMMELLALIEPHMNDISNVIELGILKKNALLKASNATPDQSTNVTMSKQLAEFYLQDNQSSELATFSFDGDNANKIVINSKYNDSQIRVAYSLDGGKKWKETNDHIIALTQEELNSITSDNDIKLKLVGSSDVYVIDILDGPEIKSSDIYANDNENLLLGKVDSLEFSLDGGKTWSDYSTKEDGGSINSNAVTGTRFEGYKTVKVRYKAHGLQLNSSELEYKFTAGLSKPNRKYIPLKHINVVGSSAYQKDKDPQNLIDGKTGTVWSTASLNSTDEKFFTVMLDTPRKLSRVEYLAAEGGLNGRLKSGKIYTSMDGKTWTLAKTFKDLPSMYGIQPINLDQPVNCKYVKIVATETYGGNKCFSGSMLNFFEDPSTSTPDNNILPDNNNSNGGNTSTDNNIDNSIGNITGNTNNNNIGSTEDNTIKDNSFNKLVK